MSPWKWQLVWHFANGTSFFIGAALLLTAILLSLVLKNKRRSLLIYPLVLIAAVEILFSATPMALWFYILWGTSVIAWLIACGRPSMPQVRFYSQIIVAILCCTAMAIELPYHLAPRIPKGEHKTLYVIGDSVSAGIGGVKEMPWPMLLGKEHNVKVINLAIAGATAKSAIKQAKQVQDANAVVLIEIGGNDMLAPTPTKDFETSLEQILTMVTSPTQTVIMLEFPLLPLQNEYGRIQRSLAKKHGVVLIPKRFFVDVLSSPNATVDLAHLSQHGHKLMADNIWAIVNPAIKP
jgi:acyl-CoA thioesterase-1